MSTNLIATTPSMPIFDKAYIDGEFLEPEGTDLMDLHNPTTGKVTGQVRLGNANDARKAIAAAKRALPVHAHTTKAERLDMLERLHKSMLARVDAQTDALIEEFGATVAFAGLIASLAAESFSNAAQTLKDYEFVRYVSSSKLMMEPVGVAALITPWNASALFVCNKFAHALAAGCTVVVKPSEMSAAQTQIVLDAVHEAGLPKGLFNLVNGSGNTVGVEFTTNPDVAKVSFTGSAGVGKGILKASSETLRRVTLELGGKSPTVILDDADLKTAVPIALQAGFMNSGQACVAGTRILVPASMFEDFKALVKEVAAAMPSGDPRDPKTAIGPMVSEKQYNRVQGYIRKGIEEGATALVGGEGHPTGLENGFFVKPTVFTDVDNSMTIAREEIFGPVLCAIPYADEEEAVRIANDTTYGLAAYVLSADVERAEAFANRLEAGRVVINGAPSDPLAPFGGFKESGLGRENGPLGLEAFLEVKSVLGTRA